MCYAAGLVMLALNISQRRYSVREAGDGRAVLLLHGFPFSHESFAPQLAAPPTGTRIIAPDHRGFGHSDLVAGGAPTTMDDMADDALALLDQLGLERAFIGGVSMGGYVAMALAAKAPTRVRGLILIDTQAGADDEAGKARREDVATNVLTKGAAVVADAMMPKLFGPSAASTTKQAVHAMMLAQTPAAIAAASRGMAMRLDRMATLAAVTAPTLIMVGEHDAITPPAKAEAMKAVMPHAALEVIPDAGHLPNLEQPEAFATLLANFVRGSAG